VNAGDDPQVRTLTTGPVLYSVRQHTGGGSMIRSVLLSAFVFLFTVTSAAADVVRGRVTDPSGRPLDRAQVLIVSGGSVIATVTADRDGKFGPVTLPPGDYDVLASAPGFRLPARRVTVAKEGTIDVELKLEIAAVHESVVVSAAQTDRPLSRVTDSVTVIDRADLNARQYETASEALRLVPGFGLVQSGGRGAVTSVFPRGGESDYTLVLVDGISLNAFGGGFDGAHLPTSGIDRVEVVRGPQSAVFGSGAIGGIVNIITRKAGSPTFGGLVELAGQGTNRVSFETSGARGTWSWGGSFERLASDGDTSFRDSINGNVFNDDYERLIGSAGVAWSDRATRRVRADVRFGRDERGNPGPYGSDPLGRYFGIEESRGVNKPRGLSGSAVFGDSRRLRHTVSVSWMDTPSTFTTSFGPSEDRSRRTVARYQADAERGSLGLSVGAEIVKERADNSFVTDAGFEGIPVNRVLAGFFAESRWDASPRFALTGGLRVERIQRNALPADAFGSRPATGDDIVWSPNPKISAAWFLRGDRTSTTATGWTKIRAGAGLGIKPPTVFEVGFTNNPSLKPERSRSFDAGIEHTLAGTALVLDATAFFNRYDDLIVGIGLGLSGASTFTSDNVGNARAAGVEMGAHWRSTRGDAIHASYTFLSTEMLSVENLSTGAPAPYVVGDWLIRRPRHAFSIDARCPFGPATVFVLINSRSRTLDIEPNFGAPTMYSDGYGVVTLGGSYRINRQFEAYARVANLLDNDYEEALGYPAQRRSAAVGLRVALSR